MLLFTGTAAAHDDVVMLDKARIEAKMPLFDALRRRKSQREYSSEPLSVNETAMLLWAAQGMIEGDRRVAPSAGALYPLELYLAAAKVSGLAAGVYRYHPQNHALTLKLGSDPRAALHSVSAGQESLRDAPAILALAADFSAEVERYGERGKCFVCIEAGQAAQNICLAAASLGLGAVEIGAFDEAEAKKILALDHTPLLLIPVGKI